MLVPVKIPSLGQTDLSMENGIRDVLNIADKIEFQALLNQLSRRSYSDVKLATSIASIDEYEYFLLDKISC